MTERERWIVYPLLFLALGASLRDKLFDQTTSKRIVCQELTVIDEEPVGLRPARILAKIGRTDGTSSGAPPVGYLFVEGQVEVDGPVVARHYATRGAPMAPALPGISAADLWRALQQSAEALQKANPPEVKPQEIEPTKETAPAIESAPSKSSSPPEATQ